MAKITLQQLSDNFQRFDAVRAADEIIMSNEKLAIILVQNQLIDGEMPNEAPITPSYFGAGYAAFKNRRNPRPGLFTPDLNLTGGNYNGIRLRKIGKYKYELININKKAPMLIEKYGDYNGFQKASAKTFRKKNDTDFVNKKLKPLFK